MPSTKPPSRARAHVLALGAALLAAAPVVTAVLPVLAEREGADFAEPSVPAMPSEGPVTAPSASSPSQPAVAKPPLRFDQSLDALVDQGIVTPAERQRIRTGATATPQHSPAHQQA
ncbi:MAG: M23 family peptidase, partial [Cyanobacteria bacterium]|nr:M23 family peptidase [Cyanobacteriota bacterium]